MAKASPPFFIYAHCVQLHDPFKDYKSAAEYVLIDRGKQDTYHKDTDAKISEFIGSFDEFIHPLYMDTSIGGNEVLNPYPGGNPDDDIIYPANSIDNGKGQRGLGRVYKECIQDTQKVMWMTFGIPYFNDLGKFYGLNANADESQSYAKFVNEGSDDDAGGVLTSGLGSIGKFLGGAGKLALSIPFAPFRAMSWFGDTAINDEVTKYYDFKPAMVQYYKLVNSIIGELAIAMGLYGNGDAVPQKSHMSASDSLIGSDTYNTLSNPDTVTNLVEQSNVAGGGGDYDYLPEVLINGPDIFSILDKRRRRHGGAYANVRSMDGAGDLLSTVFNFASSTSDYAQGADEYIGFRVEKSTDASESISNTTGESAIAGTLNNISEQAKSKMFSLGSVGDSMLDSMGKMKDDIMSTISSMLGDDRLSQTQNAASLFTGNGYFDIPEVWKNSSFTKSYTVTIELDARLDDPVSIYQNIYIPYACLLAGATPRAIGHNMYTSPFIMQVYVQGLIASPLAMIENITVRRGGADYGWTHDHLPTTINLSLTIKDLSPAMFLSLYGEGWMSLFANNSSMHEYIATLSGLGVADRKRIGQRLKRRISAAALLHKTTTCNPSYWSLRWGKQKLIRTVGMVTGAPKWPDSK